jgi:hypothetical protein
MLPAFQKVQAAGRSLIIGGSFTAASLRILRDSLDAQGLMKLALVKGVRDVEELRTAVGL